MSVLLIAEHNNKEVKPYTLNAVTAASQINEDLHVLVLGSRLISLQDAIKCFNMFLVTKYHGGRHQARLDKFNNVEM